MRVLAIDPGQKSPGYAVWESDAGRHVYVGSECPPLGRLGIDAVVVESGFIGRIGKLGMWGLGFGAGRRLEQALTRAEADGWHNVPAFTIRPDGATGWRAALPPKPGTFQKYDGLPGDVIVARLRERYAHVGGWDDVQHTDDMIEAMGIAEAAAAILARPKASQRRSLKPVKFG